MLELEDELAKSVCKQNFRDHVVCPSHLKFELYSVAALDNVDNDPSATSIGFFFMEQELVLYGVLLMTIMEHPINLGW